VRPKHRFLANLNGARTTVVVPMLKEGVLIGKPGENTIACGMNLP
jgi:hypothetical protein